MFSSTIVRVPDGCLDFSSLPKKMLCKLEFLLRSFSEIWTNKQLSNFNTKISLIDIQTLRWFRVFKECTPHTRNEQQHHPHRRVVRYWLWLVYPCASKSAYTYTQIGGITVNNIHSIFNPLIIAVSKLKHENIQNNTRFNWKGNILFIHLNACVTQDFFSTWVLWSFFTFKFDDNNEIIQFIKKILTFFSKKTVVAMNF